MLILCNSFEIYSKLKIWWPFKKKKALKLTYMYNLLYFSKLILRFGLHQSIFLIYSKNKIEKKIHEKICRNSDQGECQDHFMIFSAINNNGFSAYQFYIWFFLPFSLTYFHSLLFSLMKKLSTEYSMSKSWLRSKREKEGKN